MGAYLPTVLDMDDGENVAYVADASDYTGHLLFVFENGKVGRVELSAYATKTNRKKLTGAYSEKSPLITIVPIKDDIEIALTSTEGRTVIFNTSLLSPKTSRSTQGVQALSLKKNHKLNRAVEYEKSDIKNPTRYKVRTIPAAGALLKPEDKGEEQLEISL